MNLEIVLYVLDFHAKLDPVWHEKPKPVLHFLSSLYRPDDDPHKGRNNVAKAKYIYTS
jgi:hypothetical protein